MKSPGSNLGKGRAILMMPPLGNGVGRIKVHRLLKKEIRF